MSNSESTGQASSPLRIGVIGCGAIAQRRHICEAAANKNAKIVALCDINLDRAKEIAAKYGVANTYADYKDLLKNEKLDLVVVATPNALHAEQTIAALQAGNHVLVEKPMATTLADADAMIAAADKAGKKLMVGMNQRLMPAHVKAKKILDSGVLGKVLNFETSFKHGGPDGWSVDGAKSWFFKKPLAAMGVCGDLGVHKVDLINYLLGQRITSVTGFIGTLSKKLPGATSLIEVDDTAFLTVKTEGGAIGAVDISWTHYGHAEDNGTTIYCENGVIEMGRHPDYTVVVHHGDGTKEFHKTGAASTNTSQKSSGVIDSFIDAIQNGREPLITGRDGKRALGVILAAFEAAASGRTSQLTE